MQDLIIEKLSNYAGPDKMGPAHPLDAGIDLYATDQWAYYQGDWHMIRCGIKIALPAGMEGQIRSKSGLASKHGLTVLNSPGTVDEGYRGEIMVVLHSINPRKVVINVGDKIAQLVITKYERPPIRYASVGDQTSRSDAGFGSTG